MGSERIEHLLAAARVEFLTHGYQHLSVDGLSRTCGVSKETIYRYFPDKAALFRAAVEPREDLLAPQFVGGDPSTPPQSVLSRSARMIQDSTFDPDGASFLWITTAVARDFPDLASDLSAHGLQGMAPVSRYLQTLAGRSVSLEAASQLGALAVEGPRYLMGWPAPPPEARDELAARAAELFLQGALASVAQPELPTIVPPPPETPAPLDAHLQALLAEARTQFFARGFRGANLDEIAASARVGRGTLYRHFGSKAGLFEAAMLQAADDLADRLRLPAAVGPLPTKLAAAAQVLAEVLCSSAAIRLYRTVIGESRRAPALAREVYLRTRKPAAELAAGWIRAAAGRQAVRAIDADWAAMQFVTLVSGGNRHLTSDLELGPGGLDRQVQAGLELFLYGFSGRAGEPD
jgi:AcrR family transcriptional regulator